MAHDGQQDKTSSIVQGVRQQLLDELAAITDGRDVGRDGPSREKTLKEALAALNEFEQQSRSAKDMLGRLSSDIRTAEEFFEGGPWKLADLLVSEMSWPFDDLSNVDVHFGPLPPGYCYRNLVSRSFRAGKAEANNANNLLRLPSGLDLVIDEELQLAGDGIPGHSLLDWLQTQSDELNRLWNLRVLVQLTVLEGSELPVVARQRRDDQWNEAVASEPARRADSSSQIRPLINDFVELAFFHYDGQERDSDVDVIAGVLEKKRTFARLIEIPGGCEALWPLLRHAEIAVRVSAAIYLLRSVPQLALPVLQQVAATWPGHRKKKHSPSACLNAQRALWMYEDGKLSYEL